ncbi:predicted protein [Naegleria gruberi]|uniref:Predicted protein n=1 Tax=Naegleria gruberi TaxID=5762 RepID=D2V011_NAEGR|nr:uncharacterized protein NAEGRDRAFT_29576 [Naegleria gruberi]EFC50257.1 predicted protein [Naegleria gruberi]|eukprot:XP_002683001.1 predicted protein [Naegleria gruberi strain NEG-M]
MNSFTEYYPKLYNGRHLTWLNILSKGVVRGHFTNSSMPYYDITVSLIQLSIFLQFNNGENSKTIQDLSLAVGIPIEELIQTLVPIINFKIFTSSSAITSLDQSSIITINDSFNYQRNKISLFQHSIKQYYEEGKSNPANQKILAQIKEDRKYTLQAAIVRILKTRKQIEHKQLVNLLLAQLSSNFKPTNSDIKRAIDSLLQQEYIKRVSEDSSWYQYIA